ncbi:flagellar basal body P-ring formation chaperone FlgA [Cellvibrio mixtus]|uniref:flagellar basal body P-ring formation chaperone FlgA n=1 Tax=Cellvibrio mixtus TaxID=39650 RepID=UPI000587D6BB|nr:flagellar basal body P-ring formation chaperone FlgA [Cellvibrio mixtus]
MELPSFYRTFVKNILRQSATYLLPAQKHFISSKFCPLALIAAACSASYPALATGIYSHLQLKQDTTSFLASEYQQAPHERIDISVGNLDNRLRLGQCPAPVGFTAQDQTGLGGNITVKAQCATEHINWAVHIPAQVVIYREIPVALRDIARGESITAAHLTTSLVNVSNIRQGFAADSGAVIGREAKRNIGKGEPFRNTVLDAPTAIKRGEVVKLESLVGSIKVSSNGTAMGDGRLGQKIRVRNDSSDRIVTGVVRGQGLVQTL